MRIRTDVYRCEYQRVAEGVIKKKDKKIIMALEEEIRILRQEVEDIKGILAELVEDSVLTHDEEEMLKEAREAVRRDKLADFIKLEEL
jgi:regulator of replication initiation timing